MPTVASQGRVLSTDLVSSARNLQQANKVTLDFLLGNQFAESVL
jgi:hypothetical protein